METSANIIVLLFVLGISIIRVKADSTPSPSACLTTPYGCCPDGLTPAEGENYAGCAETAKSSEACAEPKNGGSCKNLSVHWFFDISYGGCIRFWYSGCEGNGNNFPTEAECKRICVEPLGKAACFLPQVPGPCDAYFPSWSYNLRTGRCEQFIYGGCLGNNNRFATSHECESLCSSVGPSVTSSVTPRPSQSFTGTPPNINTIPTPPPLPSSTPTPPTHLVTLSSSPDQFYSSTSAPTQVSSRRPPPSPPPFPTPFVPVRPTSEPPIRADCTNNEAFANCTLIVKARYCDHRYYAKFCCRACALAKRAG